MTLVPTPNIPRSSPGPNTGHFTITELPRRRRNRSDGYSDVIDLGGGNGFHIATTGVGVVFGCTEALADGTSRRTSIEIPADQLSQVLDAILLAQEHRGATS